MKLKEESTFPKINFREQIQIILGRSDFTL
jgi:hypothetical protein